MAMKEWFRRLQPVQLYLMLALSIAFVLTELVVSHITHALTLMVGAFHMLCNIIALAGCLITIKYGKDSQEKHTKHKKHERNKISDINSTLHGSHTSIGEVLTSRQQTAATPDGDSNRLKKSTHAHAHSHSHDHSTLLQQQPSLLKNTFGWARIDVIVMLICFVFLASLCFSLLLEALQTLVHIDHHDEMHHPIPVMCVGAIGLLLNGLCYLLIGGYTFHQGSFLHVTASGDVVLDRVVTKDSVKQGQRRLSRSRLQSASSGGGASTVPQPISTTNHPQHATIFTQTTSSVVPSADIITTTTPIIIMDNQQTSSLKSSGEDASAKTQVYTTKKAHENSNFNSSGSECSRNRQGAREMTRDVLSCVYVIICSLIVYYTENPVAKFVDPVVSIISATHLLWLSYPYMKESGLILLQTMPDTINIDSLKSELLAAFPDIVNIHDLHVWQLTANKIISTAHIIFQDPKVYAKITKEVNEFFISQGITQVTVQPEFSQIYMNKKGEILRQKSIVANHEIPDVGEDHKCLMRCQGIDCTSKHCCAQHDSPKDNTKIHKRWTTSKEIIPSNSIHDLKSIRIHPFELVVRSSDIPPEAAAAPTTTPSSSIPTNRSLSMSPSANQRIQQVGDNTATNNLSKYSKSAQDIHRCTNEHDCDRRNSTLHSNYDSLNNVSSSGTTTSNVIIRNCDNNLNLSSSDTILTSSTQNVNSSTSSNNNTIIVNQETN